MNTTAGYGSTVAAKRSPPRSLTGHYTQTSRFLNRGRVASGQPDLLRPPSTELNSFTVSTMGHLLDDPRGESADPRPVLPVEKGKGACNLHTIAEKDWLVRAHMELPLCLMLATSGFRDGWDFIQFENAERLDKRLRTMGWNLVRICGFQKSGVGDSSQQAMAGALRLALRTLGGHLSAVEVGDISLKRYPWFCLATVVVYPYWIQQYTALLASDCAALRLDSERRRMSLELGALGPPFADWSSLCSRCSFRPRIAA